MKDYIKKWWNREWSNWEVYYDGSWKLLLKRISNDGLIEFKAILK
jgi:hypothetical protein